MNPIPPSIDSIKVLLHSDELPPTYDLTIVSAEPDGWGYIDMVVYRSIDDTYWETNICEYYKEEEEDVEVYQVKRIPRTITVYEYIRVD